MPFEFFIVNKNEFQTWNCGIDFTLNFEAWKHWVNYVFSKCKLDVYKCDPANELANEKCYQYISCNFIPKKFNIAWFWMEARNSKNA